MDVVDAFFCFDALFSLSAFGVVPGASAFGGVPRTRSWREVMDDDRPPLKLKGRRRFFNNQESSHQFILINVAVHVLLLLTAFTLV